jgi:hypothetical protein
MISRFFMIFVEKHPRSLNTYGAMMYSTRVGSWLRNIRPDWKKLSGINALAYLEKSSCQFTPGANVLKLFTAVVVENYCTKLECLSLAIFFRPSLIFSSKAEPTRWKHFQVLHSSIGLDLPKNIRLGLKSLPGTSTQAYSENVVNYIFKKFY